jgi:tetratricopeptide (TPR) repeat protein
MRILNLTIVSFFAVLLVGCMPGSQILYIPPANSQMPKAQLIHVSRLNTRGNDLSIVKINAITVLEPAFGGALRPFDFYVVPGTYSIDYRVIRPAERYEPAYMITGSTTLVVGPNLAGETMNDFNFIDKQLRVDGANYNTQGAVKAANGDIDGAIADYTTAIVLNPELAAAYYNRGVAKQAKGDTDRAITDMTIAIQLLPKGDTGNTLNIFSSVLASSYRHRGAGKLILGDLDGAIADCTKAIQLNSNYADAYLLRADAKKAKGDKVGANADLIKASQFKPDSSRTIKP